MSEERQRPEQRAFSPEEVATMLGVARATVSSLLLKGKLGSKKIGDTQRIFLSDLEDYLGEERAHSLVCEINSRKAGIGSSRRRRRTSENCASDHDDATDFDFDFEMEVPGREQVSQYETVVQKWNEIDKDNEAIVLTDLSKNDVQNIRNLLYRRVGKENVIVRTAKQWDGTFKAVVRAREGNQYLRE